MQRLEVAPRITAMGPDAPEQKIADGFRCLRVRLFGRNDGVFVIDEGIGVPGTAGQFTVVS